MATAYKFVWDKGTTISRVFHWKRNMVDDGEEPDYQPVNLTGYTARMEIRDKYGGVLLYRLDSASDTISISPLDGEFAFEIPASETETWNWRNAVYDIELVDADGRVTRILQGTITLTPEVTTGA